MGEIKRQYEKYLELKVGTPFKYNHFWNLLLEHSFEEILEMKHRRDLPSWGNGGKKKCKYEKGLIERVKNMFASGNTYFEIEHAYGLKKGQIKYIIYKL